MFFYYVDDGTHEQHNVSNLDINIPDESYDQFARRAAYHELSKMCGRLPHFPMCVVVLDTETGWHDIVVYREAGDGPLKLYTVDMD